MVQLLLLLYNCFVCSIFTILLKKFISDGWKYDSNGHFMNISGQYFTSAGIMYEVTDPYITYKVPTRTDGKYKILSSTAYKGTIAHFAQEFYM